MQAKFVVLRSFTGARWHRQPAVFACTMLFAALSFAGCEFIDGGGGGGGNNSGGKCNISDTIDSDVTWGEACTSYLVSSTVSIKADVTIKPGTTLTFESGDGFYVEENGSLNAVGTKDEPIVFKGESNDKGYWHGIAFRSNSSKNELTWVEVQNSGGSGYNFRNYGILVQGRLKVTNSTFRDSSSYGLYVDDGGDISGFARNTFVDIDEYPLSVTAAQAGSLDTASSYKDSKGKSFIAVRSSKVSNNISWSAQDVPYRIQGNITVTDADSTLSIGAGTDLVFEEGTRIEISDGALSAVGTKEEPITMRGVDATPSYWNGIAFRSKSSKNELQYVHLSDGGASGYNFRTYGILVIGRAKLAHNVFSNFGSEAAVVVDSGASIAGFADNQFEANVHYPLSLYAQNIGELDDQSDFVGPSGETNGKPWVLMTGSSKVTSSQKWHKQNVPYRITSTINISESGATVTVDPGTIFEFEESGRIDASAGALNAQGTSEEPIVFQGLDNTKGYWGGLYFGSNSTQNILDHVVVSDAGSSGYNFNSYGIYVSGQLTLNNSTLKNNKSRALWIRSGATMTPSDVGDLQTSNNFSGNDNDIEDNR